MKNKLHSTPLLFKMILLVTCFMLTILYNKSHAASLPDNICHGLKATGKNGMQAHSKQSLQPTANMQPAAYHNN